MSIQSEFYALVNPIFVGRAYPIVGPDAPVTPYLTYFRVIGIEQNTLDANGGTGNAINTQLQADVWAATYGEAQAKAAAVKAALKTWTVENVVTGEQDLFEADTKLHRVMMEISTWHT